MSKDELFIALQLKYGTFVEVARLIGVSPTYLTNVNGGHAALSKKLRRKLEDLLEGKAPMLPTITTNASRIKYRVFMNGTEV